MHSLPLALVLPWGILDTAQIDPLGLVRLVGWSRQPAWAIDPPIMTVNGWPLIPLGTHRFARPDVKPGAQQLTPQAGIIFEYRFADLPAGGQPHQVTELTVGDARFPTDAMIQFIEPHYGALFDTERVLGRDDIYGYGPPNPMPDPEVVALTAGLRGSALDFGCGSGALVRALRAQGLEAYGLEIDRGPIRDSLRPDIADFITLYDGTMPSPFPDGSFDTVICSEVLEHIPNYEAALAEMARLTRNRLILTVPDVSAIPLGTRHRLIPWHLLESTHLHFFTQNSLAKVLAPFFPQVEFGRISFCPMNDTGFFISLVGVCAKQPGKA